MQCDRLFAFLRAYDFGRDDPSQASKQATYSVNNLRVHPRLVRYGWSKIIVSWLKATKVEEPEASEARHFQPGRTLRLKFFLSGFLHMN